MQPLIAHHPLLLSVMVATFLIWRVMEAIVDIKTYKRLRTGIQRQDKGSYLVLFCLIASGIFFGILIAYRVPAADITRASVFFFWLGILLMWIGIALRLYAITVLGVFFTTRVAITPEQTVVESGPYRLIRHPSYTGLLITLLGFGLSFTNNWLSLLVIMGCAVIGLSYRIQVEEYALKAQLGQRYQEYMQHTKRLIPFVL
ncbi:MAG TPA: isoprenylcysteine carboxylmethyltransferase family protein [Ktedonobacteraceae bacterium]|nr:isoprenylcysteine carboxylmethyltransferase family protein [Ktedonobacteraceae bacterium]